MTHDQWKQQVKNKLFLDYGINPWCDLPQYQIDRINRFFRVHNTSENVATATFELACVMQYHKSSADLIASL